MPPARITKLRTVIFEATHRCNLSCIYCYNYWKAGGSAPVRELSTMRTLGILRRVIDQTGARLVAFSGGEPLLRNDILELLTFVHLKGVKASILTNGVLLDRRMAADLRKVGARVFQLTLLGMDEAVHDLHCGKGSFAKAMGAIEAARSVGVTLSVTFILTRRNLSQVEPAMQFMGLLGLKAFMFNRFNPGGEGLKHMDSLMPTAVELRAALKRASRLAFRLRVRPVCSVPIPPCVADPSDYRGIHFAYCIGSTAKSYFTMDPAGGIRLCNHSPVVLGNIRRQKFVDIANGDGVERFRSSRPGLCRECPHWETCLGSCRASSEQACGSCATLDPFVARMLGAGT